MENELARTMMVEEKVSTMVEKERGVGIKLIFL